MAPCRRWPAAQFPCAVRADGAAVPGPPLILDPITTFDTDLRRRLSQVLAEPVDAGERARRLAFLLEEVQRLRQAGADDFEVIRDPGARPRALVIDNTLRCPTATPARTRSSRMSAPCSGSATPSPSPPSIWWGMLRRWKPKACAAACRPGTHRWRRCCAGTRGPSRWSICIGSTPPDATPSSSATRSGGARLVYSVADLHHLRTARQAAVEGRADLAAYAEHVRVLNSVRRGCRTR